MNFISKEDCFEYEKALTFLVNNYNKTGYNEKPVIFHSLSVANYLLDKGYDIKLAIVALLHDLMEDSNVTENDLEKEFGEEVSSLVKALSFNSSIKDEKEKYIDMFERIREKGREALIIKCADIYSNSFYIHLVEDNKDRLLLLEKIKYFLDSSKNLIGSEIVWKDLYNSF